MYRISIFFDEKYSYLTDLPSPPVTETPSTESYHISNTYLNKYDVREDEEKSESQEVQCIKRKFSAKGKVQHGELQMMLNLGLSLAILVNQFIQFQ